MDSINKEVLTTMIIAWASLCAVATLVAAFDHKEESTEKHENEKKAKAIRVENEPLEEYLNVYLDTDHHNQTAEACVKVMYSDDFPAENIQQVISNNPERTIWEWKKWGAFSKLNDHQK